MSGAMLGAWGVAVGLVTWRQVRAGAHLPVPGTLLAITLVFGAFGLVADAIPKSRALVVTTAWGLDVAGVLNLWPSGLGAAVQRTTGQGPVAAPATTGSNLTPGTQVM